METINKSCENCVSLNVCKIYTIAAKAAGVILNTIIDSNNTGFSENYRDKLFANFAWINKELGERCNNWFFDKGKT